jgi:hypothetical protein
MNAGPGQKGEPLYEAVRAALAGRTAALEDLFRRHGGGPDPRPNLKLAAAFGEEMASLEGDGVASAAPLRLLTRLGSDDAAPDTFEVFFPMAAAFGWAGRLRAGRDVQAAWDALRELAGDERAPVRVATHAALRAYALARDGATELVRRASAWLEPDDRTSHQAREVTYGAAAVVLEVLGDRQALANVRPHARAFEFLEGAIALAADAPRSAERSDGRRRLLAALPRTLATVATVGGDAGVDWLDRACAEAKQPNVRAALSDAVVRVQAANSVVGQRVRQSLEGSAKPPRDPTRRRKGAGRGKASRPTR